MAAQAVPQTVVDLLPLATKAIKDVHRLLDQMQPLIVEVTEICQDGVKRYEELGHKGRSWRGR